MDMLGAVASDVVPASAFLWQADRSGLVLPERFSRAPGFSDASDQSAARGWPVTTRRTGGGITPQGPGVLNVALAFKLPPGRAQAIRESYAALCNPMIAALGKLGLEAGTGAVQGSFCDGDYNLEVYGRKLVGTAQRWRGSAVLCHALILTDISIQPAVGAAQALADGIGLGDTYRSDAHCRLADLCNGSPDVTDRFASALADILNQDYQPWSPTGEGPR